MDQRNKNNNGFIAFKKPWIYSVYCFSSSEGNYSIGNATNIVKNNRWKIVLNIIDLLPQ